VIQGLICFLAGALRCTLHASKHTNYPRINFFLSLCSGVPLHDADPLRASHAGETVVSGMKHDIIRKAMRGPMMSYLYSGPDDVLLVNTSKTSSYSQVRHHQDPSYLNLNDIIRKAMRGPSHFGSHRHP